MIRTSRVGPSDLFERLPELQGVENHSVAVFGLGCIGAPSAIELAKAGIGELRILDGDFVDPGTVRRWPVGLSAAGLRKVDVIKQLLRRDYPYTKVKPFDVRLGGTVLGPIPPVYKSDLKIVSEMVEGMSLIYDATAEYGVQSFLSQIARNCGIPYISVDGTQGGWGGRICRILPGTDKPCWACFISALGVTIRPPPAAPNATGVIQPEGCGEPTFTGAGFDLAQLALSGVRMAVSTLCAGAEERYPKTDWDVMIVAFRNGSGRLIRPRFRTYKLKRNPECPVCGGT